MVHHHVRIRRRAEGREAAPVVVQQEHLLARAQAPGPVVAPVHVPRVLHLAYEPEEEAAPVERGDLELQRKVPRRARPAESGVQIEHAEEDFGHHAESVDPQRPPLRPALLTGVVVRRLHVQAQRARERGRVRGRLRESVEVKEVKVHRVVFLLGYVLAAGPAPGGAREPVQEQVRDRVALGAPRFGEAQGVEGVGGGQHVEQVHEGFGRALLALAEVHVGPALGERPREGRAHRGRAVRD